MSTLVVIAGPIGAGKSTVAAALADRLVGPGRRVAVVDIDDVAFMRRAPLEEHDATWDRGRRVHGALVGAWLRDGIEVVVAHGPVQHDPGLATLTASVPAGTAVVPVLLQVPYDVALARVTADPARGLSHDPDFLRRCHDRFAVLHPQAGPFVRTYRTDETSVDAIVDDLVGLVP